MSERGQSLPFRDRVEAGQALAAEVAAALRAAGEARYAPPRAGAAVERAEGGAATGAAAGDAGTDAPAGAVVLGLPRGGVPVAAQVAAALNASLDVLVVRKIGAPGQPELAVGAVASGGVRVTNDAVLRRLGVRLDDVERVVAEELVELRRREQVYRGDRPPLAVTGRPVVLVDDGLATGATMRAAVQCVRAMDPSRVTVAVPVGSPSACAALAEVADDVVCPHAPQDFLAVGAYYADFRQTDDDEVRVLLQPSS